MKFSKNHESYNVLCALVHINFCSLFGEKCSLGIWGLKGEDMPKIITYVGHMLLQVSVSEKKN